MATTTYLVHCSAGQCFVLGSCGLDGAHSCMCSEMQCQLGVGWPLIALVKRAHRCFTYSVILQQISPSLCTCQYKGLHESGSTQNLLGLDSLLLSPLVKAGDKASTDSRDEKQSPSLYGRRGASKLHFKRTGYKDGTNGAFCKLSNPKSIQEFSQVFWVGGIIDLLFCPPRI